MKRLLIAFLLGLVAMSSAQEKYAPMHRLTWEEYAGTLAHWRKKYPKVAVLSSLETSRTKERWNTGEREGIR